MSDETLFYILGSVLAVSAVAVSFVGLKFKAFPGRAMPVVVLCFAVLIGAATTYAVLGAEEEEKHRAHELAEANEEAEHAAEEVPGTEGPEPEGEPEPAPTGGAPEGGAEESGETLQLAASPTAIAFDTTSLTATKPGKITIDFDNPSAIPHDVVVKQGAKEIVASEEISESKTSVSADLSPGTYTFYCSVTGHAQAGMEGTLTVK
jgi:plastocyanin